MGDGFTQFFLNYVAQAIIMIDIFLIGDFMEENGLPIIREFPLNSVSAKRIISELVGNHTGRIKYTHHVKQRMVERRVTTRQIINVLKSRHNHITEQPHQTASGDWKFNLQGIAAGELIEVVIVLKRCEYDPSCFVITVIVK
ncbi:DUF4258 domain-containing protein [Photorhabdus aegyptia]|nr:DUF4258 domain-containing protein [Photorhabdus aegyptia]